MLGLRRGQGMHHILATLTRVVGRLMLRIVPLSLLMFLIPMLRDTAIHEVVMLKWLLIKLWEIFFTHQLLIVVQRGRYDSLYVNSRPTLSTIQKWIRFLLDLLSPPAIFDEFLLAWLILRPRSVHSGPFRVQWWKMLFRGAALTAGINLRERGLRFEGLVWSGILLM